MIDGHAHLNEITPIDPVVERAREVRIRAIIAVGIDLFSSRETMALVERFPGFILPAVGYHPWSIAPEGIEEHLAFLEAHLPSCVALGEVGIDYGAKVKKNIQQEVFSRVLALAAEQDRPAIIHSRYSHERTHRMVREAGVQRAVFHWYSGTDRN